MSNSTRSVALAKPLRRQARRCLSSGDLARAVACLRAADGGDPTTGSAILIGETLSAAGEFEAAEAALQSAFDRARASGSAQQRQDACVALSSFYLERSRLAEARQFEQLAIAASLDGTNAVGVEVRNLVAVRSLVGGGSEQLASLQNSPGDYVIGERVEGVPGACPADARAISGVAALLAGDGRRAGELLYAAYRQHKKAGDEISAAADMHFVGIALRSEGRFSEAAVCHAAAAEVWEDHGERAAASEASGAARDCRRVASAQLAVPCEN